MPTRLKFFMLSISLTNLSIEELAGTPLPVPCLFCRFLLPGSCPDDPKTRRIQETTIGAVSGNDQVKSHIGNVRGFVDYQEIPHTLKNLLFLLIHPVRQILSLRLAIQQTSPLKTSSFTGIRIWRRSIKNRSDR